MIVSDCVATCIIVVRLRRNGEAEAVGLNCCTSQAPRSLYHLSKATSVLENVIDDALFA